MKVEVAYADPTIEALETVDVAEGCSVADAVARSNVLARVHAASETLAFAVFGRRVDPSTPLAPGDRVEITRPLSCDAKAARRERAARRVGPGSNREDPTRI